MAFIYVLHHLLPILPDTIVFPRTFRNKCIRRNNFSSQILVARITDSGSIYTRTNITKGCGCIDLNLVSSSLFMANGADRIEN